MKKIFAIVLAMLLCLGGAALAEEESVWVEESCYVPQEDGTALLHLVIGKSGDAMMLDHVDAVFYDAGGAEIRDVSVSLQGAATLALPAGTGYMAVTLLVELPEGTEVAEYAVMGAAAVSPAQSDLPVLISEADGVVFTRGPEGLEATVFIEAAHVDPMYYTGYAILFDREGEYIGNVFLPLGSAAFVAGGDLLDALAQALHQDRGMLVEMGMREDSLDSILFSGVPMSGLPEGAVPAGGQVVICAVPPQEAQTLHIVDFTLDAADGRFVIHASAQNMSDAAVRLTGVPYVALHDEADNVCIVQELTLSGPDKAFAPGEVLEFTLAGEVEEGFVPVACGFITECEPVE